VRGLVARHGAEAVRAFPGIGYREIAGALAQGAAPGSAQGDILVATRQYAKRQLTWFQREPSLRKVMLSGAELPSLVAPFLS
jgi:tRNA dimethylallyltransferase